MDLSSWNDVGRAIIDDWLNPIVDLATLHAAISWIAALASIWAMQRLTRGAGFRSRHAIMLSLLRLTLGLMALALALAGLTPHITTEPPWLADLPVVVTLLAVLILIPAIYRQT
jgi:L-asparagine transporter-like permease